MKYPNLNIARQTEQADSRQVKNNAGGYTFELSLMDRVRRFLILGSDSNTYYASAREMTVKNTEWIKDAWKQDPNAVAQVLVDVSRRGLAPKVDPALYVLALGFCVGDEQATAKAKAAFPQVVRTASHLFSFLAAVTSMRGWGRALKTVVAQWYVERSANELAYQGMKYRSRAGFSHQRAVETSHPRVLGDASKGALLRHLRGKELDDQSYSFLPDRYQAFLELSKMTKETHTPEQVTALIQEYSLPREAVPTEFLNEPAIWRALAEDMPLGALLRNLGTLTRQGVLKPDHWKRFRDTDAIKKARLHPYSVLVALTTYQSGEGERNAWTPNIKAVAALNQLFYDCFEYVEPTGKRICIGLDVSGSMGFSHVQGGKISAREAAAAMCLVNVAVEDEVDVFAFSTSFRQLSIHERMSLEEVVSRTSRLQFGGTDCSLPMLEALQKGREYDAFVIYTDNETWAGHMHPHEALELYRKKTGIDAKLVVVGMTSTNFSIADPTNPNMMDVVGFDSSAPALISEFLVR